MKMNKLRREVVKACGLLSLTSTSFTSIAKTFVENGVQYSDGEGVTFAAGPKPILSSFPQKRYGDCSYKTTTLRNPV